MLVSFRHFLQKVSYRGVIFNEAMNNLSNKSLSHAISRGEDYNRVN